ncbi:MAG: hypothetical protein IJR87_04765 [Bacteroidaceae bacterium]|nr:hypothetical protein [Bacteroidaceae bacterium]
MEKFFSLAVLAAVICLSSCGGRTSADTTEEDSLKIDTVAVLDEPIAPTTLNKLTEVIQSGDATKVSTLVDQVVGQIQELIADGKVAIAAEYAGKVQEFIEANKEKLQDLNVNTATITELVDKVMALPAEAAEAADAAAVAVKADAAAVKQAVREAAKQKADEVKTAAEQKVDEAKAKANEKIEDAANKAIEKADEAIENAAAAAKKKLGL